MIVLASGEIYHVFNRGVMRLDIFYNAFDYKRFLELIDYYRFANTSVSFSKFRTLPLDQRYTLLKGLRKENILHVDIYAFCLMPNHFHFVLKQISTNGLTVFIGNVLNAYARYLNLKYKRVGPLCQSRFKAVLIESDEQFIHTCRYVHLNPSTGFLVSTPQLYTYKWSSYPQYVGKSIDNSFLNTKELRSFFTNGNSIQTFTEDNADFQKSLAYIKHLQK